MSNPTPRPPSPHTERSTLPLLERYKYLVFVLISGALLAGIAVLLTQRPDPVTISVIPPEPTAVPSETPIPPPSPTPGPYAIYITGAVATPEALVTLDHGSRVIDALSAAGGPLPEADLARINLAQRLEDGDHVVVPSLGPEAQLSPTARVLVVTATPGELAVYVVGEVAQPESLVNLPTGSRVRNAIEAAGGATENADLERLNLSQVLNDGDYVYVPALDEGETASAAADFITPTPNRPSLVHVNYATQEELETLPGVGPTIAQNIIAYRNENGPFRSLEDLDNVPRIGPSMLADIDGLVAFDTLPEQPQPRATSEIIALSSPTPSR